MKPTMTGFIGYKWVVRTAAQLNKIQRFNVVTSAEFHSGVLPTTGIGSTPLLIMEIGHC